MLDDFVSKNPGVTYELFRSGTGDVKTKLSTELDAGSTDANVLWFADLGYMYDLDDQGLIYHYSPESAKDLPDTYKYNDGMGHEVRAIYSVLAYNTTQIDKAPKDWDDVTTDDYKGSLAIANPAYSGGAMTTLSVHVEPDNESTVGWDWYQKLAEAFLRPDSSYLSLYSQFYNPCKYTIEAALAQEMTKGSPIDYVYRIRICAIPYATLSMGQHVWRQSFL